MTVLHRVACRRCGVPLLTPQAGRKWCSETCRYDRRPVGACLRCGTAFRRVRGARYCSRACQRRAASARWRRAHRSTYRPYFCVDCGEARRRGGAGGLRCRGCYLAARPRPGPGRCPHCGDTLPGLVYRRLLGRAAWCCYRSLLAADRRQGVAA
jgi:hypothetical protein